MRTVRTLRAVLVLVLVMALEVVIEAGLGVAVEGALVALKLHLVCVSIVNVHFKVVGSAGAVLAMRAVVQLSRTKIAASQL